MKYRFNNMEVDLEQFDIRYKGELVAVEPKVFDVVVYLIQQRHRLVSRNELFEQVWHGREVTDTTLSNHIKSARKALGDNGDMQKVIKTVRSRGYQFIAKVEETVEIENREDIEKRQEISAKVSQPKNKPTISTASQGLMQFNSSSQVSSLIAKNPLQKWVMSTIILILLGVLVFTYIKVQWVDTTTPTLLVVPFSVSSNNQSQWEPFADQISRELIQGFRKVSGMSTIAHPSAFTFKNNKIHSFIRRQLPEVSYVVDGVVSEGANGNIRITVELEDIVNNKLLWDQDYDLNVDQTNSFNLQGKVAASVTQSLQVILLEHEKQDLAQVPTQSVEAYNLYVQGQHQKSLMNYASLLSSIEYFSKAIAIDPNFEAPYIEKSNAFRIIMTYFDKPKDVLPKVIASATEVLSINPDSAQVMSMLGLAYVHALQWPEALNMLSKAQQKDPNLVLTQLGLALYYSAKGDLKAVQGALHQANELDPLNQEIADWGLWALMMLNDLDGAIAWGQEKMKLHPVNPYPVAGLSVAYYLKGQTELAIEFGLKSVELSDRAAFPLILLAQSYATAGNVQAVNLLLEEAASLGQYMCPYETAAVHGILGNQQKMFTLLDQAVDYQSNCLIFAKHDPRFARYVKMPRYQAMLKKIGLD